MDERQHARCESSGMPQWLSAGPVISDGAMGTELENRGFSVHAPSCWRTIEQPQVVEAVHKAYIDAGARLILTNTFGANRIMLARRNSPYEVETLNRTAVEIARSASRGADVMVFGNISSTGAEQQLLLGGDGQSPDDVAQDIHAAFKEQATILEDSGVDGILVETISYLREAILAVDAATTHTRLPVYCTMTFQAPAQAGSGNFRTYWGDSVDKVVAQLTDAGASGLGANCGELVEEMPTLAVRMRELTSLPLFFEINAGKPQLDNNNVTSYGLGPDPWSAVASSVVEQGVNVIGGCCGTTPAHIARLSERLRSREPAARK